MAAISTIVAVGGLALGAVGAVQSYSAAKDAKRAQEEGLALQRQAQGEQEKIQGEQRAQNAAQAAAERRAQIREERVRRSRVLQSAENSGVESSSGEFGALGSLGTNLAVNLGTNAGRVAAGNRVSGYAQAAAGFMSAAQDKGIAAQNAMSESQAGNDLFKLGGSIFSAAGGIGTLKTAYNSATTPSTNWGGVNYQAVRDN